MLSRKRTIITLTVLAFLFLLTGCFLVKQEQIRLHRQENTVYAIAGNKDKIEGVTQALKGETLEAYEKSGRKKLSMYGFDSDYKTWFDKQYTQYQIEAAGVLCGLYLLVAGGVLFLLKIKEKEQEHELEKLTGLLERFFGGEYKLVVPENIEGVRARLYSRLSSIGEKLHLNERRLIQEKEETKVLVTDISHQIKTPIAALKMCFALLNDESLSEEEREEFMRRLKEQIDHLETLTAALIQISRMESGMISIHKEKNLIVDTILSAVNSVYLKAEEKEITIELENPEEEVENIQIPYDAKWTTEGIVNVLDNAVKYSPKGSKIQIRLQRLPTFLRIEIKDEGVGIPKEEVNQIFKRFYRGKSENIRKNEGSGVGLYLTRNILEAQGGSIMVVSGEHPGNKQGSTFILQLRLTEL